MAYLVVDPPPATDPGGHPIVGLWVAATDGATPPQRVAAGPSNVGSPRWSPSGSELAFLSDAAPPAAYMPGKQIWLLSNDLGRLLCLTRAPAGVSDFRWSRDGTEVAFTSPIADDNSPNGVKETGSPRRQRLWVASLPATKTHTEVRPTPVTPSDLHVIEFAWSPSGSQFAATVAPSGNLNESFEHARLVIVDRRSGSIQRTLSEKVSDREGLDWSPDGKQIAFFEFAPKHFAYRLAVVDTTGGPCRYPLEHHVGTPEAGFSQIAFLRDSRHLLVPTFEKTRMRLISVDTVGGSIEHLADSVDNFWSYSATSDAKTIAIGAENGHSPPNVVVLKSDQKPLPQKTHRLTDLNPQLAACRLGNVSELAWTNQHDGKNIYGVVITPADFVAGTPRPTVVVLHGGPQSMWWNGWIGTWLSWGQLLASHGYVVFLPNPRGSIGQNWPFTEAVYRDWGNQDFHDVMDGLDVLIDKRIADPNRLGIGGWSYGGFLTASATTQTDRFKAAIVGGSWTDLENVDQTTDFSAWFHRIMGLSATDRTDEACHRLSPLTHAARCRTPTLILHGEHDPRCPLHHGKSWHVALKAHGVDTELVIYPNAGHLLSERSQQIDLMQRDLAWYDGHLR